MFNYAMNVTINAKAVEVKKYIDSSHVYLVSVYLDKDYKYDSFDEIPNDAEVVVHEFPEYFLSLEYSRVLDLMNEDFLGKFLYKLFTLPIQFSENFTNNPKAKTIAQEYFTNPQYN
jgi:hypothetical protein